MDTDVALSTIRIRSKLPNNRRFGTGFVIHADAQFSYVATCAHVVTDVGGEGQVLIGDSDGEVVAIGAAEGSNDCAVLRVGVLSNVPPLRLAPTGKSGCEFTATGYQQFGNKYLLRTIGGTLGDSVSLEAQNESTRTKAWDLKIEGDYLLQPGYSGSPVVDQSSGKVFAIVSHREGEGQRGLAISIEVIEKVWPGRPAGLLERRSHLVESFRRIFSLSFLKANYLSIVNVVLLLTGLALLQVWNISYWARGKSVGFYLVEGCAIGISLLLLVSRPAAALLPRGTANTIKTNWARLHRSFYYTVALALFIGLGAVLLTSFRRQTEIRIPPVNKRLIHIAIVLNGDVHYTADMEEGFRGEVESLLQPTEYIAHFEHTVGYPEKEKDEQNKEVIETLVASKFEQKPDYLITIGTQVTETAYRHYLNNIPIIFIGVTDPVRSGLARSFRPDAQRGNISGIAYGIPTHSYLTILSQMFPGKRFGYVYHPDYPQDVYLKEDIVSLAPAIQPPMSVTLIAVDQPKLTESQQNNADIFFGRYFVSSNIQSFIRNSSKPFVGSNRFTINNGAIASVGTDDKALGRMAARDILFPNLVNNVSLSDLPIKQTEEAWIGINLVAARKHNITVSDDTVRKASLVVR